jgi:hypothetical protein
MSAYEITRHAIQLAPLLLVPALMYAFRQMPKIVRLPAVVLLGWLGVFLSVEWYWNFSIEQAPTQQLAEDLATRDGAPLTFAYMFGWLYVVVYIAIIEGVRFILAWAQRRLQSLPAI